MRPLAAVTALLIAGFHAGLLGRRLFGAELDAAVLARWGGALLLLAVALWLRRRGVSLLWGRQALVLWLLVLLLHAGGAPDSAQTAAGFVIPVCALGLALRPRRERDAPRPAAGASLTAAAAAVVRRDDFVVTLLSPRPPPTPLSFRHA